MDETLIHCEHKDKVQDEEKKTKINIPIGEKESLDVILLI